MKTMKVSLLFALLSLTIFAASCEKDKDNDRDAFLASYSVIESCSASGNTQYNMTISPSTASEEEVIVSNYGGVPGAVVKAKISGTTMSIPNQTLNINNVSVIINTGTGALNGTLLTVTYSYSIGTDSESCSMTSTKL